MEPVPAGSKTDPLLAKAEPISNGGITSGITHLRREKNLHRSIFTAGERSENCADTKVSEEGGGGGPPGTRAYILLQPMVKTMVRQVVPLQPMEVHSGAEIHLHPVEDPMPEQADAPKGACDPVGSLC